MAKKRKKSKKVLKKRPKIRKLPKPAAKKVENPFVLKSIKVIPAILCAT